MSRYSSDAPNSHRALGLSVGTILYALMAGMLGAVWLGIQDFVELWHPLPESIVNPQPYAVVCGIIMLVSALSLLSGKLIRYFALAPALVLALFTWRWLTRIVLLPLVPGTWSGFGELLVPIAASILIFCRARDVSVPNAALAFVRWVIGLSAIAFGLAHFGALDQTAQSVPGWIPGGGKFWAAATGVADILGGGALLLNFRADLASDLLAAMYFVFEVTIWLPRLPNNPLGPVILSGNAVTTLIAASVMILAGSLRGAQTAGSRRGSAMRSKQEW